MEGCLEAVTNLVDAYSWLADGRGPYAYDDSGYDEDVKRFVRRLLETLPSDRWQPWQSVLNERERWRKALEQIQNREAMTWIEYGQKYGLPLDAGQKWPSSAEIAAAALGTEEVQG